MKRLIVAIAFFFSSPLYANYLGELNKNLVFVKILNLDLANQTILTNPEDLPSARYFQLGKVVPLKALDVNLPKCFFYSGTGTKLSKTHFPALFIKEELDILSVAIQVREDTVLTCHDPHGRVTLNSAQSSMNGIVRIEILN